jgi:MFS family permease
LVAIGLYVRVSISETPAFRQAMARNERVEIPLLEVLSRHWRPLIQGSLSIVVCYALFYISTVFALGYGVNTRHIPRTDFLEMLCVAVLFMALAAALADRIGRRPVLLGASALAALIGFALPILLGGGATQILLFLCLALGVMGLTFAPLGALLPELFPTRIAYTGASSAYNLGGILGASLAPYLAQLLLERGGLPWVGYYLTLAAAISFLSVLSMKETGRG